MKIRLVAADLDGTLLDTAMKVSEETRSAVREAAEHGIEVALCTGREIVECGEVLEMLPEVRYAVSTSGGRVLNCRTGEILGGREMSARLAGQVYEILWQNGALPCYLADHHVYADRERLEWFLRDYYPHIRKNTDQYYTPVENMPAFAAAYEKPVEKIYAMFADEAERDRAWDLIRDLPVHLTCSEAANLEISDPEADKGYGLRILARSLGLSMEEIMGVGDSENDLEMLQAAGFPAVVANAAPAAKALAKIVAPSNDDNGVAWLLRKLVRGEI